MRGSIQGVFENGSLRNLANLEEGLGKLRLGLVAYTMLKKVGRCLLPARLVSFPPHSGA